MAFHKSLRFVLAASALSLVLAVTPSFAAEAPTDVSTMKASLKKQAALLAKQEKALAEQREKLSAQEKEMAAQRTKLDELAKMVEASVRPASDLELKASVGTGAGPDAKSSQKTDVKVSEPAVAATSIVAPPKEEEKRPEVAVLPDVGGVLTPKGVLMYENSLEYVNTTNNIFTFNGVQVAEVVFIGSANATTAKRQIVQDSNRFRLGLTNRLEADIRVPYVYRSDTTSETNTSTGVTTRNRIEGNGLGDIDAGASYQFNAGKDGWPFLVGNVRYKANNADGPFDVPYDSDNVATELPTGTGFHSAEASLTAIKVSDPAVLFTNLGYVYNMDSDVNKTFGNTRIGNVDPGDAINISAGMGFSINPETSFTLGYKHSYVFETTQDNQDVGTGALSTSRSDTASVGAFMVGASYRFNPITSLNMNVEVGATREAPDVRVGLRVPVRLGTLF
ncbi:MAG: transporter [Proteobacteria bacterium]|nr:transporter [Alphaproteobacteria bacterium]NCC03330.1 transporter [Pseudomonadota bacterium]